MKQVAVAPNSLLTGSPETVFRNKTHGDVKTGSEKNKTKKTTIFQHCLKLVGETKKNGAAAE